MPSSRRGQDGTGTFNGNGSSTFDPRSVRDSPDDSQFTFTGQQFTAPVGAATPRASRPAIRSISACPRGVSPARRSATVSPASPGARRAGRRNHPANSAADHPAGRFDIGTDRLNAQAPCIDSRAKTDAARARVKLNGGLPEIDIGKTAIMSGTVTVADVRADGDLFIFRRRRGGSLCFW